MNATAAIAKALLDGKVLSIKTAFREFGVTNLPREISRLIEKKFNVQVAKVPRQGKTRYGIHVRWFEYRLPKTDYNKDGIEKMRLYISQNFEIQTGTKSSPEPFKDKRQGRFEFE